MLILNLPERESTDSSYEAATLNGHDEEASKWLINSDIDELCVKGNLEALRALDRKQRVLVRQYHLHHTRQELASQDPSRTYAWLNLLEAIRTRNSHAKPYHNFVLTTQLAHGAVRENQRNIAKALAKTIDGITGVTIAERMTSEVGIPPISDAKYFDNTDIQSHTFRLAPLPYGPVVDDAGNPVEHMIMWTCHDLYDPAKWKNEDIIEIRKLGVGGLLGFEVDEGHVSEPAGYSGHPGVYEIEQAISNHFSPDRYKVAWYINSREHQSIPALPHVHLWVVDRKGHDSQPETSCIAGGNGTHTEDPKAREIVVPS